MKILGLLFLVVAFTCVGDVGDQDSDLFDYEEDVAWSCGSAMPFDPHGLHKASGGNYLQARGNSLRQCFSYHSLGCVPVPLTCRPQRLED